MKKLFVLTLSIVFIGHYFISPVRAQSQTITLNPSADATVIDGSSDNYGTTSDITCENDSEQKNFFMKFDVGVISTDAQIESVQLSLNQTSASGENIIITMNPVSSSWEEGTVSGTAMPTVNTAISYGQLTVDATLGVKNAVTTPQFVDGVQDWVRSPSANFGIHFDCSDSSTFAHVFGSRESGSKPQLVITYSIPEESSAPIISNIQVKNITDIEAEIVWETDKNAIGFVDYGIDTSYGGVKGSGDFITVHSVGLFGLTPETTFHYRIRVKDEEGNETLSEDMTFTTKMGETPEPIETDTTQDDQLGAPANLEVTEQDEDGSKVIRLAWDHSIEENVSAYRIYRSVGDALSYTLLTEVSAETLEYIDRDVEDGTTYYYTVRALVDGVESKDSNGATITLYGSDIEKELANVDFTKGFIIFNVVVLPIFGVLYYRYRQKNGKGKKGKREKSWK